MELEKKNPGKKVECNIYYCLYLLSESVSCSVLFTSGKVAQLTWYEFSTYIYQL